MQFPASIPGEGVMDVVVQSTVRHDAFFREKMLSERLVPQISRMQALGSIDGAPEGKPFYMDSVGPAVNVMNSLLMHDILPDALL